MVRIATLKISSTALLVVSLGLACTASVQADSASVSEDSAQATTVNVDRHVGYYYPEPQTTETYVARSALLPGSDRRRRITFVTQFMAQMMGGNFAPGYSIFAKGDEAQKMIITATTADTYNTVFRMRGLLAVLTAQARGSELFQSARVDDIFTFLDLLKMIGFTQLTVTDGDKFAHQFMIQ